MLLTAPAVVYGMGHLCQEPFEKTPCGTSPSARRPGDRPPAVATGGPCQSLILMVPVRAGRAAMVVVAAPEAVDGHDRTATPGTVVPPMVAVVGRERGGGPAEHAQDGPQRLTEEVAAVAIGAGHFFGVL